MLCALTTPAPEPGIYEGIEFHEYAAWNAISNSQLSLLKKSPRHFREGNFKEATSTMRLCELYHCNVLEPHAFGERYVVQPEFHHDIANSTTSGEPSTSKGTKYVKQKEKEFAEYHCDRNIVPREWYEQALALVENIARNPEANKIMSGSGHVELSLVWDEEIELAGEIDTVRCKARLDRVSLEQQVIADMKGSAKVLDFPRAIVDFAYHRQLAHYVRGWQVLTGEHFDAWIIAHEQDMPFTVLAAPLDDVALIVGGNERRQLLELYVACRRTDEWQGPPNPAAWRLPEWALKAVPMFASNGVEV